MPGHHLAQFNLARAFESLDHPDLADFVEALDPVNRLAEVSPGFVWRLHDASGNSTDLRPADADDRIIINLSVWQDAQSLRDYTYRGGHREVLRRRRNWFAPATAPQLVLWWVPAGHRPGLAEATSRLEHLRTHGPTPEAFTLRTDFPPPHD